MRKILWLLCLIVLPAYAGFARPLEVHANNCVFNIPSKGTYVETQLLIPGYQLKYKSIGGGQFQASAQIVITYKQGTDIIQFQKYQLNSPVITDTTQVAMNLIDQKRMFLPSGSYSIDIEASDLNDPTRTALTTNPVMIDDDATKVAVSDISLIDSYTTTQSVGEFSKSGYDMIPNVINFYPTVVNNMSFYFEVYRTKEVLGDNDLLITASIVHHESEKVVTTLSQFFKKKSDAVIPILADFDISSLATGNYDLFVQVKDRGNNLLAVKKLFFQRINANEMDMFAHLNQLDVSNTFVANLSPADIRMNTLSLIPISSPVEAAYIDQIAKENDLKLMQQFLLNFWTRKDEAEPEAAFNEYSNTVKVVNEEFGTQIQYGFETDRGRVYLKYGPPNDRLVHDHEPGGLPYEIWQYYTFTNNQRNVSFVFYNPDLVANHYELIHSDAIGEISDLKWKDKVYQNFQNPDSHHDLEKDNYQDHFGSKVDDIE